MSEIYHFSTARMELARRKNKKKEYIGHCPLCHGYSFLIIRDPKDETKAYLECESCNSRRETILLQQNSKEDTHK